ncbi:hypothetical protein MGYG_05131 [Nannizzia gypsea CBS 118893]|uniref:Myb-like domain-containing protein n=1 Tax=Arthroderma gypseum (strain ATCC MYA-4604 / CBS 118893) TaxID=535722 RepID=E4UYG6_ARTGP|nr:hypothetical protein MGYG_05131 [Nannizzia gypsea CBS 118893]EFR02129.1 hypothetical protein MGYG_05131 [Nannizzia gypsea CBS 118893]
MSPPNKRRRIESQSSPNDGLSHDFDVNKARKANNLRLKSRFESIFEKYGKDFSSVGDEIDLAKGTIVVDNGHLTEMGDEHDVGRGLWDDFHPEDDSEAEEEQQGQDIEPLTENIGDSETGNTFFKEWVIQDDYDATAGKGERASGIGVDLSSICPGNPQPAGDLETGQESVIIPSPQAVASVSNLRREDDKSHGDDSQLPEDLWDAPPLPTTALSASLEDMEIATTQNIERTPSPDNNRSIWAAPHSRRRRIPHISKPKNPPKKTPTRMSKLVPNDSDSDDPIQDRTPISSTPRRPTTISTISPSKDATFQTPVASKDIYTPPQKEPISTIEGDNRTTNGASISEQEIPLKVNTGIILTAKEITPGTPTYQPILDLDSDPGLAVATPQKDPDPGVSTVTGSPGSGITTPKVSPDNLTLQEVKTLITLRLTKRKPWREVSLAIPTRSPAQLRQWYYAYCKKISGNSPSSVSWTDSEKKKLASLTPEAKNSWETVQSQFPNKSLGDIQHEWIKICLGETLWQSWVDSKTPSKVKKRPFTQVSPLFQTPIRSTITVSSPLQSRSVLRNPSVHVVREESPPSTAEGLNNREESPDPLSEAFERAWHSSGLASVQISTPPMTSRSPKKHMLSNSKAGGIIVQGGDS